MSDRSLSLVYDAIDEVNALGEDDLQIAKSPDTMLFSDRDGVDSLTFVNVLVAVEQRIMDETGNPVLLVTEETMAHENNPFQSIGTLAKHIEGLLT